MARSKISKALGGNSFAGSFMHLKLRRGRKEDDGKVGKARQGLDDRIVAGIVCSRGGGRFKGGVIQMCRNSGQSPLKAVEPKTVSVWVMTTHGDLTGQGSMLQTPGEGTFYRPRPLFPAPCTQGRVWGRNAKLPCGFQALSPHISTCSPTWKSQSLILLSFYEGVLNKLLAIGYLSVPAPPRSQGVGLKVPFL